MSEVDGTSDRGGVLHLVATPIGNLGDITGRAASVLGEVSVVACEDTRRTGRLLQELGVRAERLLVANEHTERRAAGEIVELLDRGVDVALVTDAGMPGISDPGERIVSSVVAAGHRVTVVPGPSAPEAALVVSGLPTARYVFEGFLPRRGEARAERLADIAAETRTVVLFESPRRLASTLTDLATHCGHDRPAAVVRELTKLYEEVARGTLGQLQERFGGDTRGEIVVVVGPATIEAPDDAAIVRALEVCLSAGHSKKAAVAEVSASLGVGRNRVYRLSVQQG